MRKGRSLTPAASSSRAHGHPAPAGRDATGDNLVEHLAGLDDYAMAVAAYWAAVENRPKDKITLRRLVRVVVKNWCDSN